MPRGVIEWMMIRRDGPAGPPRRTRSEGHRKTSARRELRHFNLTTRKTPMTKNSTQLSELLPTAGADDILRELVGFVAQSLMELDVANRCGASARRTQRRANAFA